METLTNLNPAVKKKNLFGFTRIVLPVLLGWLVIGLMFVKEFDPSNLPDYEFSAYTIAFIVLAFVFMLLRDVGMDVAFPPFYRQPYHLETGFSYQRSQRIYISSNSGIYRWLKPCCPFFNERRGQCGAAALLSCSFNLFLDELFFIAICPLLFIFVPAAELFPSGSLFLASFVYIFWGLYIVRLVWTAVLFIGIFRQPQWIKNMLLFLFRLPLLRRWYNNVEALTEHLVLASADFRHPPLSLSGSKLLA